MRRLTFAVEINNDKETLFHRSGFRTLAEAVACKDSAEKEFNRSGTIISVLNDLNKDQFDSDYHRELSHTIQPV